MDNAIKNCYSIYFSSFWVSAAPKLWFLKEWLLILGKNQAPEEKPVVWAASQKLRQELINQGRSPDDTLYWDGT